MRGQEKSEGRGVSVDGARGGGRRPTPRWIRFLVPGALWPLLLVPILTGWGSCERTADDDDASGDDDFSPGPSSEIHRYPNWALDFDEDELVMQAGGDPVSLSATYACTYDADEPDVEPEDHFVVERSPYVITWDALCVRDGRDVSWGALKISYWEDRAEDAWNVWLIDPEVSEVTYGEPQIDGTSDPNIPNTMFPYALERVGPAALDPGDYRVEVWAVVDDYLDSQRNEVRLTVVE